MYNVVAAELIKHITTIKPFDRIWIVKLDENPEDRLSRFVNWCISVVHGRPQWQHAGIIYQPANIDETYWIEFLIDGPRSYAIDVNSEELHDSLDEMLFSFYEVLHISLDDLEKFSDRLYLAELFEPQWFDWVRLLFNENASGVITCTNYVAYIMTKCLNTKFDRPCYVYHRCDGSPLVYRQLVTSVDLSNWRNPYAIY